jgi:hypothetical protein
MKLTEFWFWKLCVLVGVVGLVIVFIIDGLP